MVIIWEIHLWVVFADDIKALTPTSIGLNIKFNGAKIKHILYKGRNCVVHHKDVFVNSTKVECVVSADHLGHRLSTVDKSSMVTAAESSCWKSLNLFMATFCHRSDRAFYLCVLGGWC